MKRILLLLMAVALLLSACGKKTAEPLEPDADPGVQEPVTPPEEKEPFAYTEVVDIFKMSKEDVDALFGVPLNQTEEDGGVVFDYADALAQFNDGSLVILNVRSEAVPAPRGIKLGDSLESVLAKFPDDGDETLYDFEGDGDGQGRVGRYRVVYGEYVHLSSYSVLEWADTTSPVLALADEDFGMYLHFENNILIGVNYQLAA